MANENAAALLSVAEMYRADAAAAAAAAQAAAFAGVIKQIAGIAIASPFGSCHRNGAAATYEYGFNCAGGTPFAY